MYIMQNVMEGPQTIFEKLREVYLLHVGDILH